MKGRSLLEELLRQHPELDEREARGRIMRGDVLIGTTRHTKPGATVRVGEAIVLRAGRRFASRAGEKLDYALGRLGLEVRGKAIIDAGSGTGGFTDCLLVRGASVVYSVDVGRCQLAWRLRRDRRVRVMERTNIMSVAPGLLDVQPAGAVCDLAFRSIRHAASRLVGLASEGWLLALVKPQFEWRAPPQGFRGVVDDAGDALRILTALAADLVAEGLVLRAACPSGLRGRKGNREFFFLVSRPGGSGPPTAPPDLGALVVEGTA